MMENIEARIKKLKKKRAKLQQQEMKLKSKSIAKKQKERLQKIGWAVESVLGYQVEEENLPSLIDFLEEQKNEGTLERALGKLSNSEKKTEVESEERVKADSDKELSLAKTELSEIQANELNTEKVIHTGMVETPTNSPLRKKSAKATVMEWRKLHPKGKKSDCIKETKLAHATVDRWWTEKSEQFKYRSGSAEDIVMEWRTMNPFGRKADCVRDTGISQTTVSKWW